MQVVYAHGQKLYQIWSAYQIQTPPHNYGRISELLHFSSRMPRPCRRAEPSGTLPFKISEMRPASKDSGRSHIQTILRIFPIVPGDGAPLL